MGTGLLTISPDKNLQKIKGLPMKKEPTGERPFGRIIGAAKGGSAAGETGEKSVIKGKKSQST